VKQGLSEALKTILEQTCVQELDRGETYFNRANVKIEDNKTVNTLENINGSNEPRFTPSKKQYGRKKVSNK
jgi:hypothetical protein